MNLVLRQVLQMESVKYSTQGEYAMRKKKLLIATVSLGIGGAEKSLVNLLNILDYNRYDVDLLMFKRWGELMAQIPPNVNVISVPEIEVLYGGKPAEKIPSIKYLSLKAIRWVATAAALFSEKEFDRQRSFRWGRFYSKAVPRLSGDYDSAISFSGGETFWYLADNANAKRFITFFHNDFSNIDVDTAYHLRYLQKADYVDTVSEACANSLKRIFPSIKDKVHVVYNPTCVNLIQSMSNETISDGFAEDIDVLKIVSIGRLEKQKGFDIAAEAAAIVNKKVGVKFEWIVIGDGSERQYIEKIIERERISDIFRLIGKKINPYPYLKQADLFLQPSRYEGKSVAIDEARVFGLPVLATNYSSVRDSVNDGVDGIIVPMNPEGIADGIASLINDKQCLAHLADGARHHDLSKLEDISSFTAQL